MKVKTRITDIGVIQESCSPGEVANLSIEVATSLLGSPLTGGGGATVIADGGNISGTYQGTVVCEGNVTVAGTLEVLGDMIVRGDFINSDGHEVTIRGDLFAQFINFNRSDATLPQSNFTVDGDLIFTGIDFLQTGGTNALLRVGGDLIGSLGFIGTIINGDGNYDGTPGLDILVYGDLAVTNLNLNGYSGTSVTAGRGGHVDVYGSAYIDSFNAAGGNGIGQDAGEGGNIETHGSLEMGYGSIFIYGGDAADGNAGNGGYVNVAGDLAVNELEAYGGQCSSDNENFRSGTGGSVYVDGNATINDFINLSGGTRYGTLSAASFQSAPNGGYLSVLGDLHIDGDYSGHGGDVYTSGFAPHSSGTGGSTTVRGNLVCADDFRATGGYSDSGAGGDGGNLTVEGNAYVDDELEYQGGNGATSGGSGGNISFRSNAHVGYVDLQGGSCGNGNAGAGGNMSCNAVLVISDSFYADGGSCSSSDESHYANSGGNINCESLVAPNVNFYLSAGSRTGSTSVSATGNSVAFGGSLSCSGNANFGGMILNGGFVSTNYPNSAGGAGGNVSIGGNLVCTSITSVGGDSVGNTGGNGGQITVEGHAKFNDIYVTGGQSNNSSGVGGDATVNGTGGSVYLHSGGTGDTLGMLDGTGAGSAPTGNVRLGLQGSFHFSAVDMTDRSECWIYSDSSCGATLKISSMSAKATLNDSSGVATGAITSNLADSIFTANGTSTWYTITGTAT